MKITFTTKAASGKAKEKFAFVVAVSESLSLGTNAASLDKKTKGAITRALKASAFEGKAGQSEMLIGLDGLIADRVLIVGLGDEKKLGALAYQKAGSTICAALNGAKVTAAEVHLDAVKASKLSLSEAAAQVAYGVRLRSYNFMKYHTTRKEELKTYFDAASFIVKDEKTAKETFAPLSAIADGVDFTRDVVTEPANVIYPDSYAKECKKHLEKLGVKVEVLGEAQMKKLGMGSLLGVGQGSRKESKLVVMHWMGGKKTDKPVAFVGKGVTFDTGGISIKPSANMGDMKYDMGGSGTVVGLMKALAGRKAKANVIGVIGLVENMPDGDAIRPGDVLTSMSGQTIEVLNTDAEGRLVLADALWYTQDRFKPKFMIDLATLTGAIVVTLGDTRAGLFSNNDDLCEQLNKAAEATNENLWRLPMGEEYDKQINSEIADMQNIGTERQAGSITAAQFLQRFVNDVPWAHLDIAGVAWDGKGKTTGPKGATAYGVRLLDNLVAENYES
jgi:leucyl aminopeptidase